MPSVFRPLRLSLAAKLVVLAGLLALLLFMPILEALRSAVPLHTGDPRFAADEVALVCGGGQDAIAQRVADYQDTRPAGIDRLLPEGAGGTRYFATLDGKAGMTFQESAAIGLNASTGLTASVELHERAHLLQFAAPRLVSDLLRALPPPATGEYAAENPGEHFAEMAANAWDLVDLLTPGEFCIAETPAETLLERERRVPGTAGFVVWYLRVMETGAFEDRRALLAAADRLMEPQRAKWDEVFRILESRRQPGGTFVAWPRPGVRDNLEARREDARLRGGLSARIEAVQISASLAALDVAARLAR